MKELPQKHSYDIYWCMTLMYKCKAETLAADFHKYIWNNAYTFLSKSPPPSINDFHRCCISLTTRLLCMHPTRRALFNMQKGQKTTERHSLSLNSRAESKWAKGGRGTISMQVNYCKCRKQRSREHVKSLNGDRQESWG